jgi:hypothetical protein
LKKKLSINGEGNSCDAELWSTVARVTVINMVDDNLIGCGEEFEKQKKWKKRMKVEFILTVEDWWVHKLN